MMARQPIKQTRNVQLILEQLEAKPVWSGSNVTRALATAAGLESQQTGAVLTLLEKRGYLYRSVARGRVNKVTYYPDGQPELTPEPTAPAVDSPSGLQELKMQSTLLNAVAKTLQELTITHRSITVQLNYQRTQFDSQAQEMSRLTEENAKLSSKLDYIASKTNGIARAVKI